MSDIYLSITETPTVVTLTNPLVSSAIAQSVTVTNVVSVNVVTMPAINVSGGLTNAELRASAVTVALDAGSLSALENVTVTVGAAVSVGNVTQITDSMMAGLSNSLANGSSLRVDIQTPDGSVLDGEASVPVQGTVTVGNSVTIGSIPSISGTVTANLDSNSFIAAIIANNLNGDQFAVQVGNSSGVINSSNPLAISGTVTANGGNFASSTTAVPSHSIQLGWNETLYGYGFRPINNDGDELPVRPVGAIEVGSLPAISGTVTANGSKEWVDGNAVTVTGFLPVGGWDTTNSQFAPIPLNDSATAIQISQDPASTFVVESRPQAGPLTTRFGTPTTANTAFATSAVTNASRKYLLIQNVTTGSNVITVGIGFTPTTTQGIQLTAGAGITFESSYIPTGAIYILSSVTASNFTILEA